MQRRSSDDRAKAATPQRPARRRRKQRVSPEEQARREAWGREWAPAGREAGELARANHPRR